MIISDLNAPFDDHSQINSESTHDRHSDTNYSEQQIGEMPTWIKNMKESIYQAPPKNYQNGNLATLSKMQALAYNIVQYHYNELSPNKEPLALIIIGEGGTGKSYLINAIHKLLCAKCALTATILAKLLLI